MLGATVPAIGGYHMGFKVGDEWGCNCIQIYITLSRTWNVPELTQEQVLRFKTAWEKSSIKEVVVHIPYLVNLASADEILWNKSTERLQAEISRADELGVSLFFKIVLPFFNYLISCLRIFFPELVKSHWR